MIHRIIKLAFVSRDYKDKMLDVLDGFYITPIDDWEEENWSVDLNVLRTNVPDILWHADEAAVDPNGFTLSDLYYATV